MSNMLGMFNNIRGIAESLDQRLLKHNVHVSNVVNSETPGYRARGYEFEKQLQDAMGNNDRPKMRTTHSNHYMNTSQTRDGKIVPEVFIQPTESIGSDGNTVDVEKEMMAMAQNQIMYRTSADLISKKFALLHYAISGGR